jgi:hypothetical protein
MLTCFRIPFIFTKSSYYTCGRKLPDITIIRTAPVNDIKFAFPVESNTIGYIYLH